MSFKSHLPRNKVIAMHSDEIITKQSHKNECDIHQILKQYQKTGIITHISQSEAVYGDLPDAIDYQMAIEMVRQAQEGFMDLPSVVREEFGNDPYQLLAAIGDTSMRPRLEELGILEPSAPPPAPAPEPAQNPPSAA